MDGMMGAAKRKAPDDEDGKIQENGPSARFRHDMPAGEKSDAYYRELYKKDPDFRLLARSDVDFSSVLASNGQLDFSDPAAVMQLTKTLLKVDFGLKIDLPDNRLCPPVPNRHNYVLWLKELLDSSTYDEPGQKRSGLDIGTGASCIYPLLACTQRPWCFVATDIDETNLSYARKNVEANGLQGRIKVISRKASDVLIPLDDLSIDSIDFTMTNPPFYYSEGDMLSSAKKKKRPPHSACTGASIEMVCDGGEVEFVGRIFKQSLVLRERVTWYTSMLGKMSSLDILVEQLRGHGIDNYAVTEFIQGNKTKRWAIAWSFGPMRPSGCAARGLDVAKAKKLLPETPEAVLITVPNADRFGHLANKVEAELRCLELLSWVWNRERLSGIGKTDENVWSRAWRRKKAREADGRAPSVANRGDCVLGFEVLVSIGMARAEVKLRWREGHESAIFESLCGYLRGRLKDVGPSEDD